MEKSTSTETNGERDRSKFCDNHPPENGKHKPQVSPNKILVD
jgi:hypothetical protein